jgi:hypothetical protein
MLRFVIVLVAALCLTVGWSAAQDDKTPKHLTDARALVKNLARENTKYEHTKYEKLVWEGDVVAYCDCSGLLNNLLMHSYGYTKGDLKTWFGAERPKAEHYHDLIADPKGKGITRIVQFKDAQPGDLLAVKYAELKPDKTTGHIMLVDGAPTEMEPARPEVKGAVKQWRVPIIDSSQSGHGHTDTRYEKGVKHGGVGKGLLRVYTNAAGEVVAYTWSPESTTTVYDQEHHHMVIGRLLPLYKP